MQLSKLKGVPYYPLSTPMLNFYTNKFDPTILESLRLSLLTSQTIRECGGSQFFLDEGFNFKSSFNNFNEEICF